MSAVDSSFPTMGGTGRVVLSAPDRAPAELEALAATIRALCAKVDTRLSRFDPASELSRFNRGGAPDAPASVLLVRLVLAARWAGEVSGGLVDATRLGELRRSDAPSADLPLALASAPPRRPAAPHPARAYARLRVADDGRVLRPAGDRPGLRRPREGAHGGPRRRAGARGRDVRDLRVRRPGRRRRAAGRPRRAGVAGRHRRARPRAGRRRGDVGHRRAPLAAARTAPTRTTCSTPPRASRPGRGSSPSPPWPRAPWRRRCSPSTRCSPARGPGAAGCCAPRRRAPARGRALRGRRPRAGRPAAGARVNAIDYPWWLASRAAGTTAYILLTLAVCGGLLMALRRVPRAPARARPGGPRARRAARARVRRRARPRPARRLVAEGLVADLLIPFHMRLSAVLDRPGDPRRLQRRRPVADLLRAPPPRRPALARRAPVRPSGVGAGRGPRPRRGHRRAQPLDARARSP